MLDPQPGNESRHYSIVLVMTNWLQVNYSSVPRCAFFFFFFMHWPTCANAWHFRYNKTTFLFLFPFFCIKVESFIQACSASVLSFINACNAGSQNDNSTATSGQPNTFTRHCLLSKQWINTTCSSFCKHGLSLLACCPLLTVMIPSSNA